MSVAALPASCANLTQVVPGPGFPIIYERNIRVGRTMRPHGRECFDSSRHPPTLLTVQPVEGTTDITYWSDIDGGFEFQNSDCKRSTGECRFRAILPKGRKNVLQVPTDLIESGNLTAIHAQCCIQVIILPGFTNLGLIAEQGATIRARAANTSWVTSMHESTIVLHNEGLVWSANAFSGGRLQINGTVDKVFLGFGPVNFGMRGSAFVQGKVNEMAAFDTRFRLTLNSGDGGGNCSSVPIDDDGVSPECIDDPSFVVDKYPDYECSD